MIDIVVGRLGGQSPEVNEDGEMLMVNPNFELDSARIYISQRTNVDENFNIAAGKVGNFENRSAIAMKAGYDRLLQEKA